MTKISDVVKAPCGPVRGKWRNTTDPNVRSAAFLGIPFAKPPVGELRFKAPVPVEPWTEVLDAFKPAATPQRRPFAEVTAIPEPSFPGQDTLNLNVFTPAPGDEGAKLPVFVWIHGGGYTAGSPSSPWYDGISFNRDGVVTVSVSYRLGFDGFGWMEDAPLNRGIRDQICALEWVRDNISAFGGDPNRVVIGGQSAGGGSVLTLLASPRTHGLFVGAIEQSGASPDLPKSKTEEIGRAMAELAGVEPTREAWSRLSEDQILDLQEQYLAANSMLDPMGMLTGGVTLSFGPTIDGEILESGAVDAIKSGQGRGVRLLAGATEHEFTMIGESLGPLIGDKAATEVLIAAGWDREEAGRLADKYKSLGKESLIVGQALTVATFHRGLEEVLNARVESDPSSPSWAYRFTWPWPGGMSGHCMEIPFVYDNLQAEGVTQTLGDNPPQSLASAMHGDWVSFIEGADMPWPRWGAKVPHEQRVYGEAITVEIAD